MDPHRRGQKHVITRLNETERPDAVVQRRKAIHGRHENLSTSSINEFLSEADCVNMFVMGDSWDKKPEDWVEDMRIVDAKTKKRRFT